MSERVAMSLDASVAFLRSFAKALAVRGDARKLRLLAAVENVLADRDEWREQHERLLAIYQAELARTADLKDRVRKALGDV